MSTNLADGNGVAPSPPKDKAPQNGAPQTVDKQAFCLFVDWARTRAPGTGAGNPFDRRRWRMQGERVGAAVGD